MHVHTDRCGPSFRLSAKSTQCGSTPALSWPTSRAVVAWGPKSRVGSHVWLKGWLPWGHFHRYWAWICINICIHNRNYFVLFCPAGTPSWSWHLRKNTGSYELSRAASKTPEETPPVKNLSISIGYAWMSSRPMTNPSNSLTHVFLPVSFLTILQVKKILSFMNTQSESPRLWRDCTSNYNGDLRFKLWLFTPWQWKKSKCVRRDEALHIDVTVVTRNALKRVHKRRVKFDDNCEST